MTVRLDVLLVDQPGKFGGIAIAGVSGKALGRQTSAIVGLPDHPAPGASPTQRRHVGLAPGLVDKDGVPCVRFGPVILPLLAPASDPGLQRFGRQHALFAAQSPVMEEAPDLEIIDLHTLLCQFSHKIAQGKVGLGACDQPVGRRTRKDVRLMAALLAGTSGISACGRAVEHYVAKALMKRSPQMTA